MESQDEVASPVPLQTIKIKSKFRPATNHQSKSNAVRATLQERSTSIRVDDNDGTLVDSSAKKPQSQQRHRGIIME